MISLAVWPCSDSKHHDCYGVVDTLSLVLVGLQGGTVKPLRYLADHLSFDDAHRALYDTCFPQTRHELNQFFCLYDVAVCGEPEHWSCFTVVDLYRSNGGDSYVLEHVTYQQALAKLITLWIEREQGR